MQKIVRKSIALKKENKQYVDSLVEDRKVKNFSRAINEMIEKHKKRKAE